MYAEEAIFNIYQIKHLISKIQEIKLLCDDAKF